MMEELAAEARHAIELDAADADVYRRLGRACRAQGLAEEAASAYDRSLSLAPADGETIRERAFLWTAMGHGSRAIDMLEAHVRSGAEPDVRELLRRVKSVPADAAGGARKKLPAPGGTFDEGKYRQAAAEGEAGARALAAEARGGPAPPVGAGGGRLRAALPRAARAHGLLEYWSAWRVPEASQADHARIAAALRGTARAALAQAAAVERPWPGDAALIARLWEDAERALPSAAAGP